MVGPLQNRVKTVRLRGEISAGIIIPPHLVPNFDQIEVGQDVAEMLGITKYEPPVPTQLMGKVKSFNMPHIGSHDCEHAGVYTNDLVNGERVVLTEKLHGSQIILAYEIETGEVLVSSKGLLKSGLMIEKSDQNTYWIAIHNDGMIDRIKRNFTSGVVQVFGEVIPVQKGYSYGQDKPTFRVFDVRHDGRSIPHDQVPADFAEMWVPIIYDGPINLDIKEIPREFGPAKICQLLPADIVALCQGMELVSGKSLHIREGFVLRPYIDRKTKGGTKLRLKVINPKYKETGEEFN